MYFLDNVSFIAHPNTGSRSLKKMIMGNKGECINDQHGICISTIEQSRAVVCVIRNPYDLLASFYWRMSVRGKFSTWLRATLLNEIGHEDPDKVGGGLFFGLKYASHVIRFENLESEYATTLRQLKLPPMELTHVGQSKFRKGQDYRLLYDDYAKLLIVRKYSDLLTALNYEF